MTQLDISRARARHLPALGRAYFDITVSDEGMSYRVAVDSWNTVEEGSK